MQHTSPKKSARGGNKDHFNSGNLGTFEQTSVFNLGLKINGGTCTPAVCYFYGPKVVFVKRASSRKPLLVVNYDFVKVKVRATLEDKTNFRLYLTLEQCSDSHLIEFMDKQQYNICLHLLRVRQIKYTPKKSLNISNVPFFNKKMLINPEQFVKTVEACDLLLFKYAF